MSEYVARCEQCGVIERGDFETAGDAVEDHDQFHDVQVKPVATDGGDDLPDHLTRMTRFGQGDVIRCTTCGDEAETRDDLTHKEGCPDDPESPVATDGGEDLAEVSPACDSSDIYRRTGDEYSADDQYRCRRCDHEFAEPSERPARDPNVVLDSYDRVEHPWLHGRRPAAIAARIREVLPL